MKHQTKLKNFESLGNYYDQMNYIGQSNTFQFDEDLFFSKVAQSIVFKTHEALKILKVSQLKSNNIT